MTFKEVMDQVMTWLQQDQRISYRALKRQFGLDDDYLDDLKVELIEVKQVAVDQDGTVLVWTGQAGTAPPAVTEATMPLERALLDYTPSYLAEKILTSRRALEGERKHVTVLFADLKDSTELIRGLDPEAAQQLLDPALHCMMDAVHRFEGTVNQVLGDGIMALFGAPIAHEDHALRACYAALAMQTAMRAYTEAVRRSRGLELRMRVGLNSGVVVVRAIGNDLHMDYSAVGETTHLAARMEQLAMPGTIRLTPTTLRLVEGLVQVSALGPVPVKGLEEPVEVFELVDASGVRRRLQAAAARGLTPFVGRQPELEALHQALARAQTGHGQVLALVGDAGVGKSRLVYECVHAHRTQGWRVLESASVSYGKATPYFPVMDLLKRYCHVDDGDDVRTVRAKVTGQILPLDETLQDTLPALLGLLDAVPEDSPFVHLEPSQRRQRTLDGLKRVLLRESQVQPLLLVCEDLHWIDAETQALLDSLVESLPTARLVLLVTYRPEYQHGWSSKTSYTHLRLDPLPPASAEAFLAALLGDDPSLAPLTPLLRARTAGNPFFLEESVRTLVETGALAGTPGAYRLVEPLQGMSVPATVQAVLAARIDRLSPEDKHLLQTAAVIGTDVPCTLLRAIADVPEDALYRGLAHLQAAEFLYETRLFPEPEYTFRHALTHEVAYGSLLHARRRALHARIVEALEGLAGDRLAEQIERLAYHAWHGEVWDKAGTYLRQAGRQALMHAAHPEAATAWEQALQALQHLPDSPETRTQALDLRLDLREALDPLGAFGGAFGRLFDHLQEAATLAEALGDQGRLGRVWAYKASYFWQTLDYDRALDAGHRALAIATALGDLGLTVTAQLVLGQTYSFLGDYGRAMDLLGRNMAVLEGALLRERFGFPSPPAVQSCLWLVRALAELGAFDDGMTRVAVAVRLAEESDALNLIAVYFSVGLLTLRRGHLPQAIPVLERGLALCQPWTPWLPTMAAAVGYAYVLAGRGAEASPLLEQAREGVTSMPLIFYHRVCVAWLSEALLLVGRLDEVSRLLTASLERDYVQKQRGHWAWLLRLRGAFHQQCQPACLPQAEDDYRHALVIAQALGMRPLQAHCHRGLGTLYTATGQWEQARTELSTAMEMYRSMDMTFWLPETEAARAQVEGR